MRVLNVVLVMLSMCFFLVSNAVSEEKTSSKSQKHKAFASSEALCITINQLVARNLDLNFQELEASVQALGKEYVSLRRTMVPTGESDRREAMDNSAKEGQTTAFYIGENRDELGYQASFPAYFYYGEGICPAKVFDELNVLVKLSPLFKLAYKTFDDSWVYFTSVDGAFLIYPFLPLKDAVHNYPPTKQIFYKAADFKNKTFGWTSPYLDLVGAGMMVTVSYPVFESNKLRGVVSRDITLDQLTSQQLKPVSKSNLTCLIVDKKGLAIANSDESGSKEIKKVNLKAKVPVLYYRSHEGIDKLRRTTAKASSNEIANIATEGILTLIARNQDPEKLLYKFKFEKKSYRATACVMKSTSWLVLTIAAVE